MGGQGSWVLYTRWAALADWLGSQLNEEEGDKGDEAEEAAPRSTKVGFRKVCAEQNWGDWRAGEGFGGAATRETRQNGNERARREGQEHEAGRRIAGQT